MPVMPVIAVRPHQGVDGERIPANTMYDCDVERARTLFEQGSARPVSDLPNVLWSSLKGRSLSPFTWPSNYVPHARDDARPRVLQMTRYDPGSSVYRYHSAANTVEGGISALVRFGHDNPYSDLRQYDSVNHAHAVRTLFESADVVHVHMDYDTLETRGLNQWPDRSRQLLVRHYHGSQPRHESECFMQNDLDEQAGALQLGARLYHHRYSERVQWLPIPVPVDDYAALRAKFWQPIEHRRNPFVRVCHSPTHPRIKGTIELETVVQMLQGKGVPVELVMVQNMPHQKALEVKATCDVTFDSFWLGIQGSGLEAACMGQQVIAGDSEVRDEYMQHTGSCPYTFVDGVEELAVAIERAVLDAPWRQAEAERVEKYTREFHDYPAVGARYWRILHAALKERGLTNA